MSQDPGRGPSYMLDDDLDVVFQAALAAVGATMIAFYSGDMLKLLGGDGRAEIFVAADVGFGIMGFRVENGVTRAISDWTPWPDVRDAEVHVETVAIEAGPHSTLRLTIQIPRVDIESGALSHGLEALASEVLARSGRR